MNGKQPHVPVLKLITQKEFVGLYLSTLDDYIYRPLVNNQRHFRINKLLQDYGYALDLSGLNLRNLNFRCADFSGLNLKGADLRGAACNWASFSKAKIEGVLFDAQTRLFESNFAEHQIEVLGLSESVIASIKITSIQDPA